MEPRSSDNSSHADPIVPGITKALQGIQVQQQQAAAYSLAGAFRISHSSIRPAVFGGSSKQGEDMLHKAMIFEGQMNALFWEAGCLGAVETTIPIKVGRPESSEAALNADFEEALVKKAATAWNVLVSQITHLPVLIQIFAAGSPDEGWSIFKKFYAPQSAAETARLTQSWYGLKMTDGEPPNE